MSQQLNLFKITVSLHLCVPIKTSITLGYYIMHGRLSYGFMCRMSHHCLLKSKRPPEISSYCIYLTDKESMLVNNILFQINKGLVGKHCITNCPVYNEQYD